MTTTARRRSGHPARAIGACSKPVQGRQGRWVGSPDALTETATERSRSQPPSGSLPPTCFPRLIVPGWHGVSYHPPLPRPHALRSGVCGVRGVRVFLTQSVRVPPPVFSPVRTPFPSLTIKSRQSKGEKVRPHAPHAPQSRRRLPSCPLALRPHAPRRDPTGLRRLPPLQPDTAPFLGAPPERPVQFHVNSRVP